MAENVSASAMMLSDEDKKAAKDKKNLPTWRRPYMASVRQLQVPVSR
jgi:hypothetical protein